MTTNNKNIEVLIKVRELSKGLKSNWGILDDSRRKAAQMLDEATRIMELYGTALGKEYFKLDVETMAVLKEEVSAKLDAFRVMINQKSGSDATTMYREFVAHTEDLSALFAKIGKYPDTCFVEMNAADWFNIWAVIQSNIYTVQGVGHSAYIKLQMLEHFNKQEIDALTKEIIKFVPDSFTLNEAISYKDDYMAALQQMEEEANKKDNLWDRFLNLVAGNIPFKQSPQERVMMMRWVNGEKGEL